MKHSIRMVCAASAMMAGGAQLPAVADDIAVFEQGAAVATATREVALEAGAQALAWPGLPNSLLAETLLLQSDQVSLLGSRFVRDALGQYALLSQSVGEKVLLLRGDGAGGDVRREATLISANGPLVLTEGRYEVIDGNSPWRIAWQALPSGQPPGPGLSLNVDAETAGSHALALTYQFGGLNWSADYVGRYDEAADTLALRAQASIRNEAGHFDDARLVLISGEIARESGGGGPRPQMMRMAMADSASEKVSAEAAFEYYRYALPGTFDLVSGETRNVTLFDEQSLKVERRYVIEGGWRNSSAGEQPTANPEIRLDFDNGLERPLPAGSIRVYDSGEPPMLLGEDSIQHTAQNGHVSLTLGRAFDISAERRVTEDNREGKARESSRRITVSNAKQSAVQVRVIESLPGDWEITSQNLPHERLDAHRVVWVVGVPPGGKASLIYGVTWR
ncbi:MAG: hypothetical protein CMN28_13985 [Salinisphaeraceae bacterium]|nr:hypothetical protein [Salinisphaeraceae bacterium]